MSSTASNNGVDDFIEPIEGVRIFSDCISIANSGSVGVAFYEPFEFVASDHVTCLKDPSFSKYVYLFLATVLTKQKCNYNFNREITDSRILRMRVVLPITDSGQPDFEFMGQFIRERERVQDAGILPGFHRALFL